MGNKRKHTHKLVDSYVWFLAKYYSSEMRIASLAVLSRSHACQKLRGLVSVLYHTLPYSYACLCVSVTCPVVRPCNAQWQNCIPCNVHFDSLRLGAPSPLGSSLSFAATIAPSMRNSYLLHVGSQSTGTATAILTQEGTVSVCVCVCV